MMRFDDYDSARPNVPGPTCPDINALQKDLLRLNTELSWATDDDWRDIVRSVADELDDMSDGMRPWRTEPQMLEQLSTANEQLREAVRYWRDAAEELSTKVDELMEDRVR